MKELSIIVPIYNVEKYLFKCINSLIDQDIRPELYEIILINDGSTDNSLEIANSFADRHPNIIVISQDNSGLGAARNTGLNSATGKYILFVDSDDFIDKNCLKKILETAESSNVELLRFNYRLIDEAGVIIPKKKNAVQSVNYNNTVMDGKTFITNQLGWSCYAWLYIYQNKFLKKNSFQFHKDMYYEDVIWLIDVLLKSGTVTSCDIQIYNYLQRNGSITKAVSHEKKMKTINDKLKVLEYVINLKSNSVKHHKINHWYSGFISLQMMSLLYYIAKEMPSEKNRILEFIKQKKVRPFKGFHFTMKQLRDLAIMNLSPRFYMFIRTLSV